MSLISPDKLKQVNLATDVVAVDNLIKNVERQLRMDSDFSRGPHVDVKVSETWNIPIKSTMGSIWHITIFSFFWWIDCWHYFLEKLNSNNIILKVTQNLVEPVIILWKFNLFIDAITPEGDGRTGRKCIKIAGCITQKQKI